MTFSAWFSVIVGISMLGQWVLFIASGQVPEFQTEPIRIAFHLAAEGVTALALIAAGLSLLKRRRWGPNLGLLANGMLVYTVIVSPGYFAQRQEWPFVAMFAVLLVLGFVSISKLFSLAAVSTSGDGGQAPRTDPRKVGAGG